MHITGTSHEGIKTLQFKIMKAYVEYSFKFRRLASVMYKFISLNLPALATPDHWRKGICQHIHSTYIANVSP